MGYKKGQLLTYTFPARETKKINKSGVIKDFHRAVVLHTRETPFKTVLIAPITSAESLKANIPPNYVEIKYEDYPLFLDHDSYINLDMTLAVDESELEEFKKSGILIRGTLNPKDLYQLDYKLALTYEMTKFLKTEISKQVSHEMETVVEFIDSNLRKPVHQLLSRIDDYELVADIISLIDMIINEISNEYIKKDIKEGQYLNEE